MSARALSSPVGPVGRTIIAGLAVAPFGWFLASVFGLRGGARGAATLICVLIAGLIVRGMRAAGAGVLLRVLWPSGSSTPYEYGYSVEEGYLARGERDAALLLLEARLKTHPDDLEVRWRLACLFTREPEQVPRAVRLLQEITRARNVRASDDVRATLLLVELYAGRLGERGLAMRELARLIQRHPGSDAAIRARTWLGELKSEAFDRQ